MHSILESVSTIILAIIGLAMVSVLVSKKANTMGVIQASASGLANNIAVAQSPVTGTQLNLSLGYPSASNLSMGFGS